MRILGVGDYNSLGDMYWRLQRTGHDVKVCTREAEGRSIFNGVLSHIDDWRAELDWVRDGVIVFETATLGAEADTLRADGFNVVGGSEFSDRLELDRAFGQRIMREVGMTTAPTHSFDCFSDAIDFVKRHPRRYVYKLSDAEAASTRNYVGVMNDGADMLGVLAMEVARYAGRREPPFVLMDHLSGVEVGIGAYFDGEKFLEPACIDWEHKRFFPGDMGELTGEMGTVVSYRHSARLFEQTLQRVVEHLRQARHRGYLNINTIVNEDGVWPLEFTCRFGYPGFAICDALHAEGWESILHKMAAGGSRHIATRAGFAVGVVLTVPPFPYEYGYSELSRGSPIFFARGSNAHDDAFHLGEMERIGDQWLASGSLGYVMVITGTGPSIRSAQREAYRHCQHVVVANARYRNDIGEKLMRHDLRYLAQLGWLDTDADIHQLIG
jgi:phosphoribosylamine--glycine ligase